MATIEPKTITLKNGKEVCIRTPVVEDAAIAIEYLKAVFADDRFFLTTTEEAKEWQTPQREQERIEKHCQNDHQLLVVTIADDRMVSMAHADCGEKKRIQHVCDMGISILPEYRGMGLGTAIMEAMIDWATTHPVIEKITLSVWAANSRAITLYEKMGFIEEGRKACQLKDADGSYDDMVCMYRFVK